MGGLRSARRKLNEKNIWIAKKVTQKRNEFAKELVKERVKKDAQFASEVLKAVGELLPTDIKEIAEATVAREATPKEEEQTNTLTQGVTV